MYEQNLFACNSNMLYDLSSEISIEIIRHTDILLQETGFVVLLKVDIDLNVARQNEGRESLDCISALSCCWPLLLY